MKTILSISLLLLALTTVKLNAQIFATRSTAESIMLTPAGVSSVTSSPT